MSAWTRLILIPLALILAAWNPDQGLPYGPCEDGDIFDGEEVALPGMTLCAGRQCHLCVDGEWILLEWGAVSFSGGLSGYSLVTFPVPCSECKTEACWMAECYESKFAPDWEREIRRIAREECEK